MMKFYLIPLFVLLFINCLYAQQDTTFSADQIEELFDDEQTNTEDSQLYDLFEYLLQNPVNINRASADDFLSIPTIDINTAKLIIAHRNKYGLFRSIYDIGKVEGLADNEIDKLLPFITTAKPKADKKEDVNLLANIIPDTYLNIRSRTISDLQDRKGFTENKYTGSKPKTYNRLQLKTRHNIFAGALIEKDAGENSFTDFNSFFVSTKDIGFVNNIIAGDYLVEFGQGLAMWSPYSFSKGSNAVTPTLKRAHNIKPYTSSDENRFFRGIAASVNISGVNLTSFYSKNKIDANIDTLNNLILSIPLDGYHRTESELNKKNKATETLHGLSADYTIADFLKLGGLFFHNEYSNYFSSTSPFDFGGKEFNFYSLSYNAYYKNVSVSGEFAYNSISIASLNRLQITFSRNFIFTTLIRNYPRNFINPHSNGFGEHRGTQNEFGIYVGLRWRSPIGLINFYYDQFKFPYATFYNPLPSTGDEYLINYETKPFKNTSLLLKYKREDKETAAEVDNKIILADQIKQNIRFELKYKADKKLQLRTRVEFMFYNLQSVIKEKGFLIFQDIKFRPSASIKIYGRIIFFQTDSYNSRVYEFENDLIGLMTNPALFGKGLKWYFLLNYKPFNTLSVSAKYSELYKPHDLTLSSGLNEINSGLDNRISIQIDIFL